MSENESTAVVKYRPVPGYRTYRVGNDGSVWRYHANEWVLLKCQLARGGYLQVHLSHPAKNVRVHSLVLSAFVGPRPDGMECRHLNSIKSDNRLENLAWGTRRENVDDRIAIGHVPRGERHYHAKLTDKIVLKLRHEAAAGDTIKTIASRYNIP